MTLMKNDKATYSIYISNIYLNTQGTRSVQLFDLSFLHLTSWKVRLRFNSAIAASQFDILRLLLRGRFLMTEEIPYFGGRKYIVLPGSNDEACRFHTILDLKNTQIKLSVFILSVWNIFSIEIKTRRKWKIKSLKSMLIKIRYPNTVTVMIFFV